MRILFEGQHVALVAARPVLPGNDYSNDTGALSGERRKRDLDIFVVAERYIGAANSHNCSRRSGASCNSWPRAAGGTNSSEMSMANLSEITESRYTPLLVVCCLANDISHTWPSAVYRGIIRTPGRTSYEVTTGYVALNPAGDRGRDGNAKPRSRNRTHAALFIHAPIKKCES